MWWKLRIYKSHLHGLKINGSGQESWRWWLTTICNGFHLDQTARTIKGQETREKKGEMDDFLLLASLCSYASLLRKHTREGTATVWIWYVLIPVWLSRMPLPLMGTKEDREDRYLSPSLWWSSVVSQSDWDRTTAHYSRLISGLWTERSGSSMKSTIKHYSQSFIMFCHKVTWQSSMIRRCSRLSDDFWRSQILCREESSTAL